VTELRQAPPLRICIFGATAQTGWLADVAKAVPADATLVLFGRWATADSSDARILRHAGVEPADASAALRAAAAVYPGDDLILLRGGTALPPFWYERLLRALREDDVFVVSPLDNADTARSPLPEATGSDAPCNVVDALCHAYGRRQLIDWSTVSPLLSAWSGVRLRLPAAARRGVLLDHLYVADPLRALRGPPAQAAGSDPLPPSPLGELREAVASALEHDAANSTIGYPGLDTRPVVLHVLHGWGGGSERFVRDLAAADPERHHLILVARGNFPRRCYGEALELLDGTMASPPLRRVVLPNPIRSTALNHRTWAEFLDGVIAEFGVTAIVVSSLIGHSLDALRTGLPTVIVGHDFYPLWPLLHRDFGDAALAFDAEQLKRDLAAAGSPFEFTERDPAFWQALRDAYVAAAISAKARLVAPSRSMLANLLRIEPRFSTLPQSIIAHGLAAWSSDASRPEGRPFDGRRLRLVVPGRVRSGKGAELLRAALPALREHAEVFLLGAGADADQFYGERDVHVILNYRREDLPALLGQIRPDAALLLPTVAETFSYTLSELASLGIPAIATRVGALAERIEDDVDGWLVAPKAADVAAAVARLRADPQAIARARAVLEARSPRTVAEMAADYRAALLLPPQAPARYRLTSATTDRLVAATRAGEIGAAQRSVAAQRAGIRDQQRELERRAEWGMGLDREIKRAQATIAQQQAAIAALVPYREQLADLTQAHAQLEADFEDRTRWAKKLDAELAAMYASTSWRLTGPVRYLARKIRATRVRTAFAWQRLRTIAKRTRGSIASRGLFGTFRRIRDEFRRGTPLPLMLSIAEPAPDVEPFTLPTAEVPLVSIVIPVYNKIDYTVACLRSLAQHAGAAAFEVIVVDDASSDATAERLARIGGIQVIRNAQNLGFVGSCNAGAAAARGDFVLFLNNDTVVTAGWLEALLRCFDEEPDAGLVGAKLVYPDGRLQEAGSIIFADGSGWNYGRFEDPADPRYNFRREADYCSGAAILIRRELLGKLGGFDARYAPAYYEDTDLAFAVRAAGLKVFYEPRAVVVHFEGVTAGTDTGGGMKRFQVVNRDKFLEKWKNELTAQPEPIHEARFAPAAANHRARGRVLIADSYTPTPDQDSGSLRMVNLMQLLREGGYAVAFMPDNRSHDGRYTEGLQALGVEALYHPYVSDPVAWLRENGRGLDAIILSRHYVAVNYIGAARLYAPQARLIFDTVDLHYLREERAAELEGKPELARHAAQTKLQELKLMRECDVTLVVSAAEQRLLQKELPNARIEVLSNVHAVHGRRKPFEERRDLVFVGGFQHPPNIDAVRWFAGDVMPLLRANGAPPHLHIIGSKAPQEVLELAGEDVSVHGFVPDIAPYMDGCRLSVAPLRYGAGVKGKVNMAMSYGLPVVATSVAVEGMHVRAGVDVMVADDATAFAAAIRRAYDDAALWTMLSDRGLANVHEHFSFSAARTALARILPER
jgi:GT2 family glycosyltransferase/glycosyltransferase involved in cell wall biosynthesis